MRGSGASYHEALDEASKRTSVPKEQFKAVLASISAYRR